MMIVPLAGRLIVPAHDEPQRQRDREQRQRVDLLVHHRLVPDGERRGGRERPRDRREAARQAGGYPLQHPAAIALVNAASRLMRIAYPAASGNKPQVCAISTNNGLPGGCGMPSTCAAAMYSDVSQNCVVGASVNTYSTRAPRATRPASG